MTYTEATEYLFNALSAFEKQGAGAYKPGLTTVRTLADAFGNPHEHLRTIHVAGTNGKGSTAHTLAAVLAASGLTVGLFTSPHLVDFRERIRVNGKMISREEVVDFVTRFLGQKALHDLKPTFFELTTVMALEHFARRQVDVAVIEVGLGGRLDSTNIIVPDLCIITNISLDHTALLGESRAAIAAEKAGIIKPGVPVVVSEADDEVRPVFDAAASVVKAPIVYASDKPLFNSAELISDAIVYSGTPWGTLVGELTGDCQPLNTAGILTAVECLQSIGYNILERAVSYGLSNVCGMTGLMGRWMKVKDNPRVICDTGHNEGGWAYLVPRLKRECDRLAVSGNRLQIVLGFVADKSIGHILESLSSLDADFYFVAPDSHRARSAQDLAAYAAEYGLSGIVCQTVREGYEKALAGAGEGGMVFVGGSTYVVAEILEEPI